MKVAGGRYSAACPSLCLLMFVLCLLASIRLRRLLLITRGCHHFVLFVITIFPALCDTKSPQKGHKKDSLPSSSKIWQLTSTSGRSAYLDPTSVFASVSPTVASVRLAFPSSRWQALTGTNVHFGEHAVDGLNGNDTRLTGIYRRRGARWWSDICTTSVQVDYFGFSRRCPLKHGVLHSINA